MTNVVDNIHDVFAKGGKLDSITVQRQPLLRGEMSILAEYGPDYIIIPEHCTGLNTVFAVQRELPRKLVMPSTGTRVIFGA